MADYIECSSRVEWLHERRNGIGASEVATVLGVNPYKSAYTLWAEKCGKIEPQEAGIAARVGNALEPMIADLYAEKTGYQLVHTPYTMHVCEALPCLRATLDRAALDPNDLTAPWRVVEIKSIGEYAARAMRDGEPLLQHQVQLQAQLAVMGWKVGDLACLVGNRAFEVFTFERHERLIAKILERVAVFWQNVQNGTPPQVDDTISTARTLAALHPNDSGEEMEASAEVVDAVRQLQDLKADIKSLEGDKVLLENRIKASMGNATFARGPGFVVSWKTSERKGFTVQPSTVRTMRINMKGTDNE